MKIVFRVFAIDAVKKNLGYYITEGAISGAGAKNLITAFNSLLKYVAVNVNDLLTLLNVPQDVLYAPLAEDYVEYYSRPNFGEAVAARL